ncbi:uncharacterized protein METZ01_LOCUS266110 [marine metagenome]|uniref:Uncharacterized protein n=1 Tax=marine metagenome TaxID=408172 RepID=A0A382JND7_9ZZZZ
MGRPALLLVLVIMVPLSGCFFGGTQPCNKPQEYQSSKSVKPVEVPPGLTPPDAPSKLVIPPGELQTQPIPEGQPCPDEPPDYFDTNPV